MCFCRKKKKEQYNLNFIITTPCGIFYQINLSMNEENKAEEKVAAAAAAA